MPIQKQRLHRVSVVAHSRTLSTLVLFLPLRDPFPFAIKDCARSQVHIEIRGEYSSKKTGAIEILPTVPKMMLAVTVIHDSFLQATLVSQGRK